MHARLLGRSGDGIGRVIDHESWWRHAGIAPCVGDRNRETYRRAVQIPGEKRMAQPAATGRPGINPQSSAPPLLDLLGGEFLAQTLHHQRE